MCNCGIYLLNQENTNVQNLMLRETSTPLIKRIIQYMKMEAQQNHLKNKDHMNRVIIIQMI
jgi:hypothetical protein